MKRIYKYMIGVVVFGATAFMSVPTLSPSDLLKSCMLV
jgi:hypothetical protein